MNAVLARRSRSALLALVAMVPACASMTIAVAGLAVAASVASAAPEPDAIPRRWQLDFQPGPLRVVNVRVNDQPRLFYVLTYKVVNKSGQDVLFAPSFDLVTGKGEVIRSGRNVPSSVTGDLIAQQGNAMIQDQISILGELGQGEPNAREGLVVFAADDQQPGELSLFAAGFSGESTTVKPIPGSGSAEPVVLRKTRQIRYAAPGLLTSLGSRPLEPIERAWVMR